MARFTRPACAGFLWLLAAPAPAVVPDEQALTGTLERAGRYVQQFGNDSAVVIADEAYTQEVHRGGHTIAHRDLRSEMMFVFVPERQIWFAVRKRADGARPAAAMAGGSRWHAAHRTSAERRRETPRGFAPSRTRARDSTWDRSTATTTARRSP